MPFYVLFVFFVLIRHTDWCRQSDGKHPFWGLMRRFWYPSSGISLRARDRALQAQLDRSEEGTATSTFFTATSTSVGTVSRLIHSPHTTSHAPCDQVHPDEMLIAAPMPNNNNNYYYYYNISRFQAGKKLQTAAVGSAEHAQLIAGIKVEFEQFYELRQVTKVQQLVPASMPDVATLQSNMFGMDTFTSGCDAFVSFCFCSGSPRTLLANAAGKRCRHRAGACDLHCAARCLRANRCALGGAVTNSGVQLTNSEGSMTNSIFGPTHVFRWRIQLKVDNEMIFVAPRELQQRFCEVYNTMSDAGIYGGMPTQTRQQQHQVRLPRLCRDCVL